MKLNILLLAGAALIAATGAQAQAQTVADAINDGASAYGANWVANNVGWYYTPSTSYTLAGFSTRFSGTDNRLVTESFYSGTVDTGLTLLGSGTLTAGTDYTAPTFTPVALTAGTQYFFAFGNVSGLGANVTADDGATYLPDGLHYDFDAAPNYKNPEADFTGQPIVRFYSAAGAVPEPATWAMMLLGFGMIGFGMRARRSKQTVRIAYA